MQDFNGTLVLKGYIYNIRGVRVMLDMDLAQIYGYSTKDFNRQVQNNIEKFEQDFMFQLSDEECEILRCKNSTSSWGGRRWSYLPSSYRSTYSKSSIDIEIKPFSDDSN